MKLRHLSILYILLYCSLTLVACQDKKQKAKSKQTEEIFDWSPGVGAANLYPMELYRFSFIFPNGASVSPAPPNLENGTWGQENGSSVVGDVMKPIPVALDILWLSYTENKFYKGHFQLPHDKILQLFKQGFEEPVLEDNGEFGLDHRDYNNIVAGIAPGGVVVVWVNGGAAIVDIGRFQATETKVRMEDFAPSAFTNDQTTYVNAMIKEDKGVVDNLAKNGVPFGLWDKYRERFSQQLVFKFDQAHKVETNNINVSYLNGEKEILHFKQWAENEFKSRARVKEMRVEWTDSLAGKIKNYVLEIKFDEAEMFKVYKEVYGVSSNQHGELITEINEANDHYKVYLQVGSKKLELVHQKGQICHDNADK
jgi:hypothetical protein